jgi:nitrogen fixation/metabolism regulation signal transduction histidine kinase
MIIRPAPGLVGAARRIGAGDLSARAGSKAGSGELGELARAFDEMGTALEQRRTELEGYAAELQRTADERRALLTKLTAA